MFAFSWLNPISFFQTSCFLGPPIAPTQSVKRPENTQTFLNLDTNIIEISIGNFLQCHQIKTQENLLKRMNENPGKSTL